MKRLRAKLARLREKLSIQHKKLFAVGIGMIVLGVVIEGYRWGLGLIGNAN